MRRRGRAREGDGPNYNYEAIDICIWYFLIVLQIPTWFPPDFNYSFIYTYLLNI